MYSFIVGKPKFRKLTWNWKIKWCGNEGKNLQMPVGQKIINTWGDQLVEEATSD